MSRSPQEIFEDLVQTRQQQRALSERDQALDRELREALRLRDSDRERVYLYLAGSQTPYLGQALGIVHRTPEYLVVQALHSRNVPVKLPLVAKGVYGGRLDLYPVRTEPWS